MIIGVDYASVDANSPPDWAAFRHAAIAAGSSLGLAIFRASWGTQRDATLARDWHRAQDAGLVTGGYLYLRDARHGSPADQVHAFADAVGALRAHDLPPILDVEDPGMPPVAVLEHVHAAWTEMRGIYGAPPIIYTSNRVWTEVIHNLPAGEMVDSPLWLAKPWPFELHHPAWLPPISGWAPAVPSPWGDAGNWWMHQYQGDAFPVPGFSNTVDLSRFQLLREGERGRRVSWVQQRLDLPQTGVYDAAMGQRLRTFQSCAGLVVDGIVGPRTFAALAWTAPRQ